MFRIFMKQCCKKMCHFHTIVKVICQTCVMSKSPQQFEITVIEVICRNNFYQIYGTYIDMSNTFVHFLDIHNYACTCTDTYSVSGNIRILQVFFLIVNSRNRFHMCFLTWRKNSPYLRLSQYT